MKVFNFYEKKTYIPVKMEVARFPPRKNNRKNVKCAVKDCKSTSRKELEVRFHNFPIAGKRFVYMKNNFGKLEKTDRLEAWIKVVKVEKVNSGMKVCSLHFRKDDYILPDITAKRRYLKSIAVPSCNLPNSGNAEPHEVRVERARRINLEENIIVNQNFQLAGFSQKRRKEHSSESSKDIDDALVTDKKNTLISSKSITTKEYNIQVQSDFLKPTLLNCINSDAELSSLTGIESFSIFNTIVERVTEMFGNQLEYHNTKMSIHEKVLMCYMKLKQNMSYNCLAILSQRCSGKTCQRIFFYLIKALSACLKSDIKWPSRETISKNLPRCFEGLEDVRVILDCTEVFIQKTQNLCCQLITYSRNKKSQTCKFMTGATPAGNISYVSKVYGGRISDKTIFRHSDIKHLLEPGDAIMVDRGFTVDEKCISNNWKCYRLPISKERKQFTKAEATITSKIAKARVHIERSKRRIKTFKIIGETMPSNLIPVIEDIFIVICATVNLSSPIMKDDKFMPDISLVQ